MDNELVYNDTQTDEGCEVIKMDEHAPINDTECRHETLIPNQSWRYSWRSHISRLRDNKCGVGFTFSQNITNALTSLHGDKMPELNDDVSESICYRKW